MRERLVIELLGPPRLRAAAQIALPTRKALAIVAILAVSGPTSRARLADLLWSEHQGEDARRNLRQELHRLQATELGAWIEARGDRLALCDGVDIDLTRFRAAVASGDLAAALDLYRGPLLSSLELKGAPGFVAWLDVERETLARIWRSTAAQRASQLEQAGEIDAALAVIRRLLDDEPLQEAHHRHAMRLLHLCGQREAALAQFERCCELLRTELDLQPLPETVALARQIQAAAPPPAGTAQPTSTPELTAPLIGRDQAWIAIGRALGRLTLIEGEAGVGKTRLAAEFARAHGPLLVLKGHEISRETPFYPVAEALLQAYRNDSGWFDLLDPVWRAEVGRLLPMLADDEPPDQLPALEARGRLLEGLAAALITAAQRGSLLFDDLHWIDASSAELMAHVARRTERVRLIATARPEELAPNAAVRAALAALERDGLLIRVPLAPLAEAEVLMLVRALSGSAHARVFSRRLHGATAGNPLFILETLRDLFGAGVLRHEAGTWATPYDEQTEDYRELPLSRTVREAVLRRIDRLGDPVRRLLEAASLAGDGFRLQRLSACTALSELELVDAADRAAEAELIVEDGGGYRFAHDLIRRSLDDALSGERRRLLHRQLAAAPPSEDASAADIARHLESGGRPVEAIAHRLRAASDAERVHALREALGHYEAALADGAAGRQAFAVYSNQVELLRNLGDDAGRQSALREMDRIAAQSDDPELIVECAVKRCVDHFEHDRYDESLRCAQATLEQSSDRLDATQRAALLLELGAALRALGRIGEAEDHLRQAMARYRRVSPLKYANCAYWLSQCAAERGQLQRARRLCDLSLAATERAGYRRGHALSLRARAEIAFTLGAVDEGLARLEAAWREAHEIGSRPLQRTFLERLVECLTELGRAEAADDRRRDLAALQTD